MKRNFRFLLLFSLLALAAKAQDFVVIVHPAVGEASLSHDDFSNILLGKKTNWSAGTIKLAVLTEGKAHEAVMKTHAQRTPDQFDKHWKKLVFTGKGTMPQQLKTDAEMVAYVAKTPGSIGYVAAGGAASEVKVLSLQ